MQLRFLGTTASIPDVHEDCPCFLVNEAYLFDCGWNVTEALRESGCDIFKIRHLFFTHMHHDHYLGLAGLLFFMLHGDAILHKEKFPLPELTIYGPSADVERVVKLTADFLQMPTFYADRGMPKVVPLKSGDRVELPEAKVEVLQSRHPVDALSYRFTDKTDGTALAATGDTAYNPKTKALFYGCRALIHDSTLGNTVHPEPPEVRTCGHSTLPEAVRAAEQTEIPVLFPVHMPTEQAQKAATELQPTTHVQTLSRKGERCTRCNLS